MFGPVGTLAGIFLFVAGSIITYFSIAGLVVVLIGAFVGFTSTITSIDFGKKRLRFSIYIFGLFPIGKWILIQSDMKIGIKKSTKLWRTYSQSNRTLDIADNDYNGEKIMPIQKSGNLNSAKFNLDKLSKQLEIGVI